VEVVGVADDVGGVGEVHQFDEYELVVRPVVCVAETEKGGVIAAGWVLAEVFELLCVLDAPPLTDGEMLNTGCTLIAGATVIIGEAVAIARAPPCPCRPILRRPWRELCA